MNLLRGILWVAVPGAAVGVARSEKVRLEERVKNWAAGFGFKRDEDTDLQWYSAKAKAAEEELEEARRSGPGAVGKVKAGVKGAAGEVQKGAGKAASFFSDKAAGEPEE